MHKIPKQHKYLFDGSKTFYDFTDEEKSVYRYYATAEEMRRTKRMYIALAILAFVSVVITVSAVIYLLRIK